MIILNAMSQKDYDTYLSTAVTDYAGEKIKAGTWTEQLAFQRASEEYQRLLPNGIETPDNYFYRIDHNETKVGVIWIAKSTDNPETAFIYDLQILKQYQDQGFGKQALKLAGNEALKIGFKNMALHVFGSNKRAIHVYRESGFEVTDINMEKKLSKE